MTFVKIDRFYVNLEHVSVVEEADQDLMVTFKGHNSEPMRVNVSTTSGEGRALLRLLTQQNR
jgi:hypothetical protein